MKSGFRPSFSYLLFFSFFLFAFNQANSQVFFSPIGSSIATFGVAANPSIFPQGPLELCDGRTVLLRIKDAPSGAKFNWFKDGQPIANESGDTLLVGVTGNYSASVKISGSNDLLDAVVVNVNPLPYAVFSIVPGTAVCANTPISFINNSSGTGLTYKWDFGDPASGANNSSSLINPIHSYSGTIGVGQQQFTARLIATNSKGCNDTLSTKIKVNQRPGSELKGTGFGIYNGLPYFKSCSPAANTVFNFVNSSTTQATNKSYKIVWGDNTPDFDTTSFISKDHPYTIGNYNLLFIVTGANDCIDTARYYVYVGSNPGVGLQNPGNTSVCSENPLEFPLSGAASNPPGTMYQVFFNDGSDTLFFSQPAPAFISHAFMKSSCGTTSSDGSNTYINSFSAVIKASNPCGVSSGSVVPIYVSQKPVAKITLAKSDTVCTDSTITFRSAKPTASVVENGVCSNGKIIWEVSPASGWMLAAGDLGTDYGLADPTLWREGTMDINLVFTQPGTYQIKMRSGGSGLCNPETDIKTICVNANPVAEFELDKIEGCLPLTVNAVNKSNQPNCGFNTYKWLISYVASPGCVNPVASYEFLNGTSDISENPVIKFLNPGSYQLELQVTTPGGCISNLFSRTITVKDVPVVTLVPPAHVCEKNSFVPAATVGCFTDKASYFWGFAGASPAASTSLLPGPITYNDFGLKRYFLEVTNECGITRVDQTIEVDQLIVADAGKDQMLCGTVAALDANLPAVGTGKWTQSSGPSLALVVEPSNPKTQIQNLVLGVYKFLWTITNGSCSNISEVSIRVISGPTTATAGPDQQLCTQYASTLAANTPVIGTGAWTQVSGPAAAIITDPANPTTTITSLVAGDYVFRWSISFNNCVNSEDDVTVSVYENPSESSAGLDKTICANTLVLDGNLPFRGKGNWVEVSGPNIPAISNPSVPNALLSGLIAGKYVYAWVISNGNCPVKSDTFEINRNPSPTQAAAGIDQSICSKDFTLLEGNLPAIGTGEWSQISGPSTARFVDITLPTTRLNGLTYGDYVFKWTISSGICAPTTDEVRVSIYETATTALAGPDQVLCGTSVKMAANTPIIGKGNWSVVSGTAGAIIMNPSSETSDIIGLQTGDYVFRWTITNGACSSFADVNVKIVDGPTLSSAGPDQSLCKKSTSIFAANTPLLGTGLWTQISGPNTASITTPNDPNSTVSSLMPGRYVFRWTISFNNCLPSFDDLVVDVFEDPSPADAGVNQTICAPSTSLTAQLPAKGTGQWAFVQGPSIPLIQTPNSINSLVTNLEPGIYSFKWDVLNGACGLSSDTVFVTVNDFPTVANAGTDQLLCSVSAATLSANAPDFGTGKWSQVIGPTTVNFTNSFAPNTIVTGMTTGKYIFRWTISNGVCSNSTDDVQIEVFESATPSKAGVDQVICGSIATMAANTPTVGTAVWSMVSGPSTPLIVANGSPTTNIISLVKGDYQFRWTVSNGVCESSSIVTISVVDGSTIADAGTDQLTCNVKEVVLSGNEPVLGKGTWKQVSGPSISNIVQPNQSATLAQGLVSGEYVFRWAIDFSNCPTSTDEVKIIVYDLPSKADAGTDQTICATATSLSAAIPSIGIGKWNFFSGPNQPIVVSPAEPATNVQGLVPGTYKFVWTVENGNCPSNSDTVLVVVADQPTIAAAGNDQQLCNAPEFTLTGNSPAIGQGLWTCIAGPSSYTISNPSNAITKITGTQPGVYKFVWKISNSVCSSTFDTLLVTNYESLQNTIDGTNLTTCAGQVVQINGNAAAGGNGVYAYQWQQSTDNVNWQDIPLANLPSLTLQVTQSVYLRRVVNSLPCTLESNTASVVVQPSLSDNILSGNQSACVNTLASVILGTIPKGGDGNFTYQWQSSSDGGATWNDIAGANGKDFNPGRMTVSTCYRRIVSSNLCSGPESSTSAATCITVHADAAASFTIGKDTSCWPFAIDIKNTSPLGIHERFDWYANENFIASSNIFPNYSINTPNTAVVLKMVAISKYGCKADSVEHLYVTKLQPAPRFDVSVSEGCGPLLVQFTNLTQEAASFKFKWDFGNGELSFLKDPSGVNFKPNPVSGDTTYLVTLYAYNECDTQQYQLPILVKAPPKAIFTASQTTGCSPFAVTFNNGSRGIGVNYFWDFGDGNSIITTARTPLQHVFHTGLQVQLPVKLKVENECGVDSFSLGMLISPNDIGLDFAVDGSTVNGCVPSSVRIVNNSKAGNLFLWNFGDGFTYSSTANKEVITHTYNRTGDYDITLVSKNGCADTSVTKTIHVYMKPIPDFRMEYQSTCIGDSLHFINTTDTATSFSWIFDDGNFSKQQSPYHFFKNAGSYNVKMLATIQHVSGYVCTDSIVKTVKIVDMLPGKIHVLDSVLKCQPFDVVFTNLDKPSASIDWDFGDGTTASGDVTSHRYAANGNYLVKMVAIDQGGCRYEASKLMEAISPQGTFSYSTLPNCDQKPIRFEVLAQATDSIRWNFGDGQTLVTTAPIVYHSYQQPGKFIPTVELIAGVGAGCKTSLQGSAPVLIDKLKAGFRFTDSKICDSTTINFIDTALAHSGIASWQWEFGDGATGFQKNEKHGYNTANNYRVRQVVTSNYGCTDTVRLSLPVSVIHSPVAQILSNSNVCVGDSVRFQGNVISVDPLNYNFWKLSGLPVANTRNFSTSFAIPGIYVVEFKVGTENGCYDTATANITVNALPVLNASNDKRICVGQSASLIASGSDNYNWYPSVGLSCTNCATPVANPLVNTDYVVTTTTPFGCTKSDTVKVEVVQKFKLMASPNDTICIGQSSRLNVSGATGYSWSPSSSLSCINCTTPIANPTNTTNYRVIGYDAYNCFTDTAFIVVAVGGYPKVSLGDDKLLSTGTLLPLKSTITNGPIKTYSWTPALDLSCSNCAEPIALVKKDMCYELNAQSIYGCVGKDTVCVKVFCNSSQVFIPTAFTPDGDGKNDVLMVRASGIKQVRRFTIYNRWGEIVFERTNVLPNDPSGGWDGRIKGVKATSDVYVFIADVICDNDVHYSYKGNVTLIN